MNKRIIILFYILSFLLIGFTAGAIIVNYLYPKQEGVLLILQILQAISAVSVIYMSFRFFLQPLLRLDQQTAQILSSLKVENASDEHSPILARFQALIDREFSTRSLFRQAELDALQSQVNPHFLYNTLECIRGQAVIEGNRSIADMARSLSQFFRYSISRTSTLVPVADELKNVDAYIKIQNYRFGDKYEIRTRINPEDREFLQTCLMPRLTLQPIVENSLLHGLNASQNSKEYIEISTELTDTHLILSVEDHGNGMSMQQLEKINNILHGKTSSYPRPTKNTGIALPNINERIQLLFGKGYGLRVYSTPGIGCKVEIILPIKSTDAQKNSANFSPSLISKQ